MNRLVAAIVLLIPCAAVAEEPFALTLHSRVEVAGRYHEVNRPASWDPKRTAVIVCDMWDLHHCLNAVRREGEMAPRMDQVLKAARGRGSLIIHAPSGCMDAYASHPARLRAKAIPRSKNLPKDIGNWCYKIPSEEKGTYPIDQSDGGEDDDPAEHAQWVAKLKSLGKNPGAPWSKQVDKLTIDPNLDMISDDGNEVWSILEANGIDNVILMGVHTNMCVLGRPFGLRRMVQNGKNAVLMKDMTDTMYNPNMPPKVSHFSGSDLIFEHIEKYVCPTITSDQVLGGKPFRFKDDARPRVVFLVSEDEYRTETTLPEFASRNLAKDFRVNFVFHPEGKPDELEDLRMIADADLLFLSMRRRVLPKAQLEAIRRFVDSGKPVIGIRTASHAFSPSGLGIVPAGREAWTNFDAEILGGNYKGHHSHDGVTSVERPKGVEHPILSGIEARSISGHGTLYRVSPLAASATPLLMGSIPGQPSEPVAWTNLTAGGGRVFYTSLGHPEDFGEPDFRRLLCNAVYWAMGRGF